MSKSYKLLGLIKCTTSEFTDISVIFHLYKTIVLPTLLYCSQIWSPFVKTLTDHIESVKHRFLRYLSFRSNRAMSRLEHNYTEAASFFDIKTIKSLHHYHDGLLTFKIIHNIINSKSIVTSFRERQLAYNLRRHRELKEETSHTNYGF